MGPSFGHAFAAKDDRGFGTVAVSGSGGSAGAPPVAAVAAAAGAVPNLTPVAQVAPLPRDYVTPDDMVQQPPPVAPLFPVSEAQSVVAAPAMVEAVPMAAAAGATGFVPLLSHHPQGVRPPPQVGFPPMEGHEGPVINAAVAVPTQIMMPQEFHQPVTTEHESNVNRFPIRNQPRINNVLIVPSVC